MTAKHSEAFIEQALVKAYSRGDRTIKLVAENLNVSHHTLKYWMKNQIPPAEPVVYIVSPSKGPSKP